ncbi:MAG: FkbM family methyltransferase [Hyphomicrobiaceae bacterium]
MLTDIEVRWAYSEILGRQPEDENVVSQWLARCGSLKELVSGFLRSDEFRIRTGQTRGKDVLYHATRHGFMFPVRMSDLDYYRCYVACDYEAEESDVLVALIRAGDTVVDLGARHGWFTMLMARAVGVDGSVVAFEPSTGESVSIAQGLAVNGYRNVTIVNKAVGDQVRTVRYSEDRGQIVEVGLVNRDVEMITLDGFFANWPTRVTTLKMDIDGAETLALRGGLDFLRKHRPSIVMEVNDAQQREVSGVSGYTPIEIASSIGYRVYSLSGDEMTQEAAVANFSIGRIFSVVLRMES